MASLAQPGMDGLPEISIDGVDIVPNECGLTDPLSIRMSFSHDVPLSGVRWRVRFTVDTVKKKKIVDFGETQLFDYPQSNPGCPNQMEWYVDNLQMTDKMAKDVLNNVGLLVLSLMHGDTVILDVNFVTQVSVDGNGMLMRNIFSPI